MLWSQVLAHDRSWWEEEDAKFISWNSAQNDAAFP